MTTIPHKKQNPADKVEHCRVSCLLGALRGSIACNLALRPMALLLLLLYPAEWRLRQTLLWQPHQY
jgi:hypothetical protein